MPTWCNIRHYQNSIYEKWKIYLLCFTRTKKYSSVTNRGAQIICAYQSYMAFITSWMTLNQVEHLIISPPKHPNHYIDMCKIPYCASNHCESDKQILNYLDIHDHLAMCHAYKEYRSWRKQSSVSIVQFIYEGVECWFIFVYYKDLLGVILEVSNDVSAVGNTTRSLFIKNGISGSIKIVQGPHHQAYPIEDVIESCNIPDLVLSICCWLDLNGYDGSSVGCQWDYNITQLLSESVLGWSPAIGGPGWALGTGYLCRVRPLRRRLRSNPYKGSDLYTGQQMT